MNYFSITLTAVLGMLIYTVIGYVLFKTKIMDEHFIANLAKLLICVCAPSIQISSINAIDYSPEILADFGLVLLLAFVIECGGILLFSLFLRKKYDITPARVYNIGCVLGNYGFFGIPILNAIFPGNPMPAAYAAIFSLVLNIVFWSIGSYILSGDKKYISAKNMFLNPVSVAAYIGLILFVFGIKLPPVLENCADILSKSATPICMMIVGMRLATIPLSKIFLNWQAYVASAVKLIVLPLFIFLALRFLPIKEEIIISAFVLSTVPSASNTLSFSEVLDKGQEAGADLVLMSTVLSVITIPVMTLLI